MGTGTLARLGRAKPGSPSPPKVQVLFDGKERATAIHTREALIPGQTYSGPAIVTEYSATTAIPPGKRFHVDNVGNLLIAG